MEKNREGRDVRKLCDLYGVTRGGYYAWRKRSISQHRQYDLELMSAITEVHQGFKRAYGAPRLHAELCRKGFSCSVRRINRLMKELGIKASTTGLYVWRPGQHQFYAGTDNALAKAPPADAQGVQWAGDFTHIRTGKGWLYHAVVIDLFSRRVVGWSFSRQRNTELTKSALMMALSRNAVSSGCIFHSDQGVEYAAHEYRELVESAGLTRSMSRKATPLDNAVVESFFHSMKAELIHQVQFDDQIEATAYIIEYIEFYNRERLHSTLGFQSPMEYESLCA
ncbi:IS3 family transposase [Halioxenophilus sp. WMMB6]|uniref:IS3 family transposase n=1 Tax=Halioxenophilus sp. WMMB6 TaxID=3073815 RepID=UPI00295F38A2|nr:IS3 family transposase [Halioxenophilus sp. WMMB6]